MSNVPSDFDQVYNEQHSNDVTLSWLIFGIIAATILGFILIYMYCKRTRMRTRVSGNGLKDLEQQCSPVVQTEASSCSGSEKTLPPSSTGSTLELSPNIFTHDQLAQATANFSDANFLGQGGFGNVHKGVLPNGKEVAIKQLKIGGGQGKPEFWAEVTIISRVHHRHLVSLVGYCNTGKQRMLVYEFVPNGTLKSHLHGKRRPTMSWPNRMKVALGSAKGLEYLHADCQPKIIHRDIKADNILLDHEFEAKVADFGLARPISDSATHVSTGFKGTFGYVDPEYASSGKLTDKYDVFSFGVVLLELITGLNPIIKPHSPSAVSLVEHTRRSLEQALENGKFDGLVDRKLQKHGYNSSEMTRMIACASACVRRRAQLRPQMRKIVQVLEGSTSVNDLKEGIKPDHGTVDGSYGSKDLKKFRKLALEGGQSTGG